MSSPRGGADPGPVLGAETLVGLEATERPRGRLLRLAEWEERFEGLRCGITLAEAGDFGVAGQTAGRLLEAYGDLAGELGFDGVALPVQVHGNEVVRVGGGAGSDAGAGRRPLLLSGRADGQVGRSAGWLLAATAADCVPVYAVRPGAGAVGLAHAGWRGVAAGVAGRLLGGLAELAGEARGATDPVWVHLGPAICGACYEVDRPVLAALGLEGDRARVDLRGLLARQLLARGVSRDRLTVSTLCTKCGLQLLHSHRASGAAAGRMAAFLGFRTGGGGTV